MSYERYILFRQITNGGRVHEMSPEQRREFDALGITRIPPMTLQQQAAVRRRYLEVSSRAPR
jgi:hypothetical protein